MASPVVPNDFKSLISSPTAPLCSGFVKALLQLPTKIWQFFAWLLDAAGNFTSDARRQIIKSGDLIFSAGPLAADSNRLLADGSEVPQATYPELYAVIGATYGVAGVGNFKLPDFRARFPIAVGTLPSSTAVNIASNGGAETVQLIETNLPKIQLGLECTAGTDNRWNAVEATGSPDVNSDGIGALNSVGNRPKLQTEPFGNQSGDTTKGVAFDILPPYFSCFIYIAT